MLRRAALVAALLLGACTAGSGDDEVVPTEPSTTAAAVVEAASPEPRMGHAMVAIGDGELLVFGGRAYRGNSEAFLQDTWIYDTVGATWREVTGPGPLARSQHAMAYDPSRDEVVLFGGYVGSTFTYGDTWVFAVESEEWQRLSPTTAPSARAGSVMVFDPELDGYVMYAGAEEPPAAELPLPETWLFDPDLRDWSLVATEVVPRLVSEGHPTLFELAMVYDESAGNSLLMVAGESTWVFDSKEMAWSELDLNGTQGLGADYMTAAAYHPRLGAVAYGGAPSERTQATYVFDGGVWSELVGAVPGPVVNHAMAYDNETDLVYLFGGAAAVLVLDGSPPVTADIWVLHDEGWRLQTR